MLAFDGHHVRSSRGDQRVKTSKYQQKNCSYLSSTVKYETQNMQLADETFDIHFLQSPRHLQAVRKHHHKQQLYDDIKCLKTAKLRLQHHDYDMMTVTTTWRLQHYNYDMAPIQSISTLDFLLQCEAATNLVQTNCVTPVSQFWTYSMWGRWRENWTILDHRIIAVCLSEAQTCRVALGVKKRALAQWHCANLHRKIC